MRRWLLLLAGGVLLAQGCRKRVAPRAEIVIAYLRGRGCGGEVVTPAMFEVSPSSTACSGEYTFQLSNGRSQVVPLHHPLDTSEPVTLTLARNVLVVARSVLLRQGVGAADAAVYVENPRRPAPPDPDLAQVSWAAPYYLLFRVRSMSRTGSLLDFPYGASDDAASYFFGRSRNRVGYCSGRGRRSGPFAVSIYRDAPATREPPTPVTPWTSADRVERPPLLCSHTHKSAFAVRITDPSLAAAPRQPFAVELRAQGAGSHYFRVTPGPDENFTVLTVFTDEPR